MRDIPLLSTVKLTDGDYTVVETWDALVKLRDNQTGVYRVLDVYEMSTRLLEPPGRPAQGVRDFQLEDRKYGREIARLAGHLNEMINGVPRSGESANPKYDLDKTTPGERFTTKLNELHSLGISCAPRTLHRWTDSYKTSGASGLVDRRGRRKSDLFAGWDARIVAVLRRVMEDETDASTGTIGRLEDRFKARLFRDYPTESFHLPARTTFWKWVRFLDDGKYTFGNAANRRSKAKQPQGLMNSRTAIMPGSEVQIDTTPFDVTVLDDAGKRVRAHLTIMLDKATQSILATSVLLGGTKGVDHALLLAKCLVPRPMRQGSDHYTDSVMPSLPWADELSREEIRRYDTTRPYIVPARIMTDNGADYLSETFRSACNIFGISLTESSPGSPTDKGAVERAFETIKTDFVQRLFGYTGGSVDRRGIDPQDDDDLMDVYTLSQAFDTWVNTVWQNKRHESLRDPQFPKVVHTPNTLYTAMFDMTGFVKVPMSKDTYIDLMPIEKRTLQPDGFEVHRRQYNSVELQRLRSRTSGKPPSGKKWVIHHDPYDPTVVWVKDPETNEYIDCDWIKVGSFNKPFSKSIRSEARRIAAAKKDTADAVSVQTVESVLASTRRAIAAEEAEIARRSVAASRKSSIGLPERAQGVDTAEPKPKPKPKPKRRTSETARESTFDLRRDIR